ncbi:MAG: hypothetical protein M3O78_06265 [Chloroflexota bacterium]|nr:hypothetical protein [Chloroflexota bacterium]
MAGLFAPFALILTGAVAAAAGWLAIRHAGARPSLARRLAGAREVRVGKLHDITVMRSLPSRPVRVVGRVRCSDPIVTPQGDRLVAFHRDVEIELPGSGWRSIERLRETRSFDLWDHDGWLTVDAGEAAEPLVVLPHVWEGSADALDTGYQAAVARLAASLPSPPMARSVTRMLSVVDRLLVLAELHGAEEGRLELVPPRGGYIISALDLDAAMRILGGGRPALLLAGMAGVGVGATLVVIGLGMAGASLITGM